MEGLSIFGKASIDTTALDQLGLRGRRIVELASLNARIAPGFILCNELLGNVVASEKESYKGPPIDLGELFDTVLPEIESIMHKRYEDASNPLLLKVAESPMLNLVDTTATVHNIGLCDTTVEGFGVHVGKEFAWKEYVNMIKRVLTLELKGKVSPNRESKLKEVIKKIDVVHTIDDSRRAVDVARTVLSNSFFHNAYDQLMHTFKLFHANFEKSSSTSDSCLLVQTMVFGNWDKSGGYGSLYTRDTIKGAQFMDGTYSKGAFDEEDSSEIPIQKMEEKYRKILERLCLGLEERYREIRRLIFTIENECLWVIDQQPVAEKSAQADLATLLSLLKRKKIDSKYVVNNFNAARLSELLHPSLDMNSVKGLHKIHGGISGAAGAAVGRVYFNADRLIEARQSATLHKVHEDFILAMPATYAEDVKGIEAGNGVVSSEGGYASHAPVVARSLGKVAMVNPNIRFKKDSMVINGKNIKEGDYITLNVPYQDQPSIYLGSGSLIQTDPKEQNISEFIKITDSFVKDVHVRANADLPKDAEIARHFGAQGIGLCRTEHMFFHKKRINIFRAMIIAGSYKERQKALNTLEKFQVDDFYSIFKIMRGYPVTIRLLDAPLHEFLPHSIDSMNDFIKFFRAQYPNIVPDEIRKRCDLLTEFNPMLGHRGVRLAISYPEIYRMQIRAIFKATIRLRREKISIAPEIMIPLVMVPNEIKAIRNGKRIEGSSIVGVRDIEHQVRKEMKENSAINYSVGVMIELPAAVLLADKIAAYAQFFSLGTNDLTQTTNGLSRDDFNNFFTVYNQFDLLEGNPFRFLTEPVKELIEIACERGKLVRPNIKIGLCGEHGAEPANIPFAISAGLNYVSCSPYGIPLAKWAIARHTINTANQ